MVFISLPASVRAVHRGEMNMYEGGSNFMLRLFVTGQDRPDSYSLLREKKCSLMGAVEFKL